jgi:hypothetical protein
LTSSPYERGKKHRFFKEIGITLRRRNGRRAKRKGDLEFSDEKIIL